MMELRDPMRVGQVYGDPTVQYDKFADRWIFTEFAWTSASVPYFQVNFVAIFPSPDNLIYSVAILSKDGQNTNCE